jgi:hypothetical protein
VADGIVPDSFEWLSLFFIHIPSELLWSIFSSILNARASRILRRPDERAVSSRRANAPSGFDDKFHLLQLVGAGRDLVHRLVEHSVSAFVRGPALRRYCSTSVWSVPSFGWNIFAYASGDAI